MSGQSFSAGRALAWLDGQMAAWPGEGFPGLRVAVDMSWALRPVTGVEQLPDFEQGVATVRICRQYAPPGIRLAGELDYRREEPLALALAEAIRIEGDIMVNMAGLAFIDGSCARMIAARPRAAWPRPGPWCCGAGRGSPGGSPCRARRISPG